MISYADLLEIFFGMHDPTTLNRQGNDVGTQYRSAIFYESEAQRETAEAVVAEVEREGPWEAPIVTEVSPLDALYMAEADHEDYFVKNQSQPYCRVVIAPKVAKFRERFAHRLQPDR
jgi:peptide-methionine (S)-S-oxide reductase